MNDTSIIQYHNCIFKLDRIKRQVSCRSEEHTSELQSPYDLVCRLLLEKKKKKKKQKKKQKKKKIKIKKKKKKNNKNKKKKNKNKLGQKKPKRVNNSESKHTEEARIATA